MCYFRHVFLNCGMDYEERFWGKLGAFGAIKMANWDGLGANCGANRA